MFAFCFTRSLMCLTWASDASCAGNNSLPQQLKYFLFSSEIFLSLALLLSIEEELILVSVSAPQNPCNISCNLRQGTISNLPITRRNSWMGTMSYVSINPKSYLRYLRYPCTNCHDLAVRQVVSANGKEMRWDVFPVDLSWWRDGQSLVVDRRSNNGI